MLREIEQLKIIAVSPIFMNHKYVHNNLATEACSLFLIIVIFTLPEIITIPCALL